MEIGNEEIKIAHNIVLNHPEGLTTIMLSRLTAEGIVKKDDRKDSETIRQERELKTNALRNKLPKYLQDFADIEYVEGSIDVKRDNGKSSYPKQGKLWRRKTVEMKQIDEKQTAIRRTAEKLNFSFATWSDVVRETCYPRKDIEEYVYAYCREKRITPPREDGTPLLTQSNTGFE